MSEHTEASSNAEDKQALQQAWIREQFQKANRYLAEQGIIPAKVHTAECRYLAPLVAIWKLEASQPEKKTYWVIGGDLPADYVDVGAAANARDAVRYFSMTWQMKAENLIRSGATRDATQAKFAQLLVARAESLYKMHQDNQLWQSA